MRSCHCEKFARETQQAAAVEFDDAGGHRIQEAPVMGDDDRGTLPGAQHLFQPGDPFEVEMVGGFVQQQQIRFVDQGSGQRHALARPAGQASDLRVGRQAELFQHSARAGRALPVFVIAFGIADHIEDRGVVVQLGLLFDGGDAQSPNYGQWSRRRVASCHRAA